ncbi:MAG: hypothetical protein ABIJ41_01885 [Candidatus Omnitrophota bacterium]
MIYLFLGEDRLSKDAKLAELKKKIFSNPSALKFDYEVLDAPACDAQTLKKSLLALPAIAKKRCVVIRECHKLSRYNQDMLIAFSKDMKDSPIVILDSDVWDEKNAFVRKMNQAGKIIRFATPKGINVFDLTRAIGLRKTVEAMKILSDLLSSGNHPLQILGGLVWFWGKSKNRMPAGVFENGLLALQAADLNIKRSRLTSEHALELLVVKLCL